MKIIGVAAVSMDAVFGLRGAMPWAGTVPLDMKRFASLTLPKNGGRSTAVVMGRETWFSLPEKYRPLPNRRNIVLSSMIKRIDRVAICRSLENAIALCEGEGHDQVSIIGGKVLITEAANKEKLDGLHLTIIGKEYLPPNHVLVGSPADHGYVLFPELLMVEKVWPGLKSARSEKLTQLQKSGPDITLEFIDYQKK